ncbi:MAG: hypothetical protein ABJA67_12270 [Chthonomonadales bacterium]
MNTHYIPLDAIQIAKPCPVSWDSMQGDDRIRNCSGCNCKVYNIVNFTREEAEELLLANKPPCLRIYQRPDGKVMTKDCIEGVRIEHWRLRRMIMRSVVLLLTLIPAIPYAAAATKEEIRLNILNTKWREAHLGNLSWLIDMVLPATNSDEPSPMPMAGSISSISMGAPRAPMPPSARLGMITAPPKSK